MKTNTTAEYRNLPLAVLTESITNSSPVRQLSDAVRRTEEICLEPVYPPSSDAPEKRRGVAFPTRRASAAGSAKRHAILFPACRARLLHFISPAGKARLTCGMQSRCCAAGER